MVWGFFTHIIRLCSVWHINALITKNIEIKFGTAWNLQYNQGLRLPGVRHIRASRHEELYRFCLLTKRYSDIHLLYYSPQTATGYLSTCPEFIL